ncbi:urea ABC transporter permease subunit UrtB [Sulfurirhabdus autotrophica]|nr:urea ABC transporter permease subunit UrtB [Sulfurirhabdus autotrophica]
MSNNSMLRFLLNAVVCCTIFLTASAFAADDLFNKLATGDSDEKIVAINQLVSTEHPAALPVLQALKDGELNVTDNGVLVIISNEGTLNALDHSVINPAPENVEAIMINNRIRGALDAALATLQLVSGEKEKRLAAANELLDKADINLLPAIQKALLKEKDKEIKAALGLVEASIQLKDADVKVRLKAIGILAESDQSSTRTLLKPFVERQADGQFIEPDESVRAAAKDALAKIKSRLTRMEYLGRIFSGISLGSILLLAALGLAITYGLMGVINMAHGELLMIGAYTTFLVQLFFKQYFPSSFDAYLIAAVPASFIVAAMVGMLLERTVIRHLYGRPLETLLATWGISLLLIQTVRNIFGAQNVEVVNPSWMSGGIDMASNLVLPYNRIVIIGFAFFVLLLVWLLLNRTRLGLFVRAVTQNRKMADCLGVPTRNIDMWTFGLGSGIAGLGGCALSQIGNVGPDLGQSYIVDSFMVVVLGGVGQLAGTVSGALGLGVLNKFLEPFSGPVMAKILILLFIIIFIQRRPQGLFALKGRVVEH